MIRYIPFSWTGLEEKSTNVFMLILDMCEGPADMAHKAVHM